VDHVLIRRLEHLAGSPSSPALRFGVEVRDRPGPLHKLGAYPDEGVWVQLHGGLFVARAVVRITWIGEYDDVRQVRERTRGSALYDLDGFWSHRPRYGYAGVVALEREAWVEPFWAGPRTYGYEWVRLESEAKRSSWLDLKPAPRRGEALLNRFRPWRGGGSQ
jgi:hypothetical protein